MALKFYESPFHASETAEVASNMMLRTDMTIMIRDIIQHQGWTQQQAANHLHVSQPRISDIMNGKIEKFTLDFLLSVLDALGFKARFSLNDQNNAKIDIKRIESQLL